MWYADVIFLSKQHVMLYKVFNFSIRTPALGTVCHAIMMASSGKLLSEKVDVMRMTFYTSPVSCFVIFPFYLKMEAPNFHKYYSTHAPSYLGPHSEHFAVTITA
jgi:hypothetical protein